MTVSSLNCNARPVLARRLAQALAEGEIAPPGRAMPERVVVSGHSAGAHFAVVLGAELARRAPQRLAGAVLLDPVAGRGFEEALQALSQTGLRPVLSVAAREHPCNARHNAHPALRRLREATVAAGRDGLAGVVQGEGSTHMDAEGENTDLLAWAACGRQWLRGLGPRRAARRALSRGHRVAAPEGVAGNAARPPPSCCHRKANSSVSRSARCALSAAPPCPPSMFS